MKKVLLLGGSYFQVPSVQKAKELGYYTITCDYLPDNPGHKFADEYHNVSTTDKEAVLKLAQELKIDGIVCYASDPAAITAAYVAEKMGLAGQPYKSVEILANKDLFRKFLAENGFNTPRAQGYTKVADVKKDWDLFKKPIMVKPVDSSGSKGITKVEKLEDLDSAFEYALNFTRAKRIVVEEYIETQLPQISGDGFSVDGKLVFACFGSQLYDKSVSNPFTPVACLWPHFMPEKLHKKLCDEVQKALDILGMKTGAYNIEARIDNDENVYLMEIGPRNGGCFFPQVMEYLTDIDMVECTIKAAMGEDCSEILQLNKNRFCAYYALHSSVSGRYKGIEISEEIKSNILETYIMKKEGDTVESLSGSNAMIGIVLLKFSSNDEMHTKMDNMSQYVRVVLQ